jgi:hypothetical protein
MSNDSSRVQIAVSSASQAPIAMTAIINEPVASAARALANIKAVA